MILINVVILINELPYSLLDLLDLGWRTGVGIRDRHGHGPIHQSSKFQDDANLYMGQ